MGYSTDFVGGLIITPALNKKKTDYINLLGHTRRMRRDVGTLMEMYKGKYGYPFTRSKDLNVIYGNEGEYFAKDDGDFGQSGHGEDKSIIDYNCPPGQIGYDSNSDFNSRWDENTRRQREGLCQPGLWCQWEVSEDGTILQWDGGEKFYNYVEWLKYLINHFFSKWGVLLNGEITWEGEDSSDLGKIVVENNVVKVLSGKVTYDYEEDDDV